jgi:hypothetical protein
MVQRLVKLKLLMFRLLLTVQLPLLFNSIK